MPGRVFHGWPEMRLPGSVVTMEVFDGFHRGHVALVDSACEQGRRLGQPAVLVTFSPHPLTVLAPERTPRQLLSIEDRVELALTLGVDAVVVLPFNADLAAVPAEDFVADGLVGRLGVRDLVVGDNFRCGRGGDGDWPFSVVPAKPKAFVFTRSAWCARATERFPRRRCAAARARRSGQRRAVARSPRSADPVGRRVIPLGTSRRVILPGDHGVDTYRSLTALVVPRPIVWVSTISSEGVGNLAPHSFFTVAGAPARRSPIHLGWRQRPAAQRARSSQEPRVNCPTRSAA